jgi:hypothetical protein
MITIKFPSEDEKEKQHQLCDDGYRRIGDDDTVVVYAAVPIQAVWFDEV